MLSLLCLVLAGSLVWITCRYIDLKKSLNPKEKRFLNIIKALSSIVDSVEDYSTPHSDEISDLALKIAERTSMSDSQKQSLSLASRLHDIGMLMVTIDLIKSQRGLNEDDAFIMKSHPLLAEHYLKQFVEVTEDIPSIIRWHHERWDGFGYPDNLQGRSIPLSSRILAIADAVSAMKAERGYRGKSYSSEQEIINELKRQSGLQFDPYLVKITVSILEEKQ